MKNLITKLLMVAVLAMFVGGCAGDQIKTDLEDMKKVVQTTQGEHGAKIAELDKKWEAGPATVEESIAVWSDMKTEYSSMLDKFKNFQPKSAEMKVLYTNLTEGYSSLVSSLQGLIDETKNGTDSGAIDKFNQAQELISTAQDAISKLAAAKGLDLGLGK